jgi:hypothetical protein
MELMLWGYWVRCVESPHAELSISHKQLQQQAVGADQNLLDQSSVDGVLFDHTPSKGVLRADWFCVYLLLE